MAESTDSDIIFRKRPKVGRSTRISDESSTSEIVDNSGIEEDEFEPLFFEIFGAGDEYNYIYKKKLERNEELPTKIEKVVIPSECYEYINGFLRGFSQLFRDFNGDIIKDLLEGYSPEYLGVHLKKMAVKELYFILDLIEEYKGLNTKSSLKNVSTQKIPGLLSVSEFICNLEALESVYMPSGNIDLPFAFGENASKNDDWGYDEIQGLEIEKPIPVIEQTDKDRICTHFKKLISQIATNPVFVKRVFYSTVISILEPEVSVNSVHSISYMQRLYCTGNNDINDQIRRIIIERAFETAVVNRETVEHQLIKQGMLSAAGGLQELVNLIISLRGQDGTYAGVYMDRSLLSVVKVDAFGNFIESSVFKEHEMTDLQIFLEGVSNVCLTSTSPNVKYTLQNGGINFMYVPKHLSFFEDYKELSIPYNIAIAVQNPILYFSRVLYNISNRYPIVNYRGTDMKMLERAVRIACATCKLDWINTTSHRFGFMLHKLLGLEISSSHLNFEKLDALSSLRQVFDDVTYANICTNFYLLSSNNPLDRTLVHPVNHSLAVILFKSAYHALQSTNTSVVNQAQLNLEKDKDKIIEMFVNNPELLSEYSTIYVPQDNHMQALFDVKQIMLRMGDVRFTGAPDDQIFDDVVPHLEVGNTYSGTMAKVGNDFYLCQISNATVFIKKLDDFVLNQIVKVEITGRNNMTLSYQGRVVNDGVMIADKFRSHSLFKDMPYDILEDWMNMAHCSIAIRPSSTPGHCCVVCKVEDDLFLTFKLKEKIDPSDGYAISYEYKDNSYQRIDVFINEYVKRVYKIIQKVVSFKYYFPTAEQAERYLKEPGDYIKYAVILSRTTPGYIELLVGGKRVFVKIEDGRLVLRDHSFGGVDEFIRFIKTHIKSL